MQYICMEYEYMNCRESPLVLDRQGQKKSGPLSLPESDRPREKLIRDGPESLSDEDLLSIVLVSGVKGNNVTLLARKLIKKLDNKKDIPTVTELCRLNGMGVSKACSVAAMLELGRRRWASGQRIRSPEDIYRTIRHYADRKQEKFICLSLNGAHELIAARVITIGLVNRAIVHPREVFADPIQDRASALVAAHNHPSGNVQPSEEDNGITWRLKASADILGLNFLDHLIFSGSCYFSYRQEGLLKDK